MRLYIEVGLAYIGDHGSEQQLPLVRSPKVNILAELFHNIEIHELGIYCRLPVDIWANAPFSKRLKWK